MSADLKQKNSELRWALQRAREDITWMLSRRAFLNASECQYLHDALGDFSNPAPPEPVATFECYVDGQPRITWTADPLPAGSKLYGSPAAAEAGDLWQPIETAPKDGTTLLLGRFNEMGNWCTMRGQWTSQAEIDNDWEDPDGHEQGWYEVAITPDAPNCWSISPTHWQPLPVRPTASAGDPKGGAA